MTEHRSRTIPIDIVLPQLPSALDTVAMQNVFQKHLCSGPSIVANCRVECVEYIPHEHCTVGYRILFQRPGQDTFEQVVYAKFFGVGVSEARYQKACTSEPLPESGKDSVVHVPELNCVVWRFPYDRRSNYLPPFSDPDFISRAAWPRLSSVLGPLEGTIEYCRFEMLRYKPEKSCTVAAVLGIVDPSTKRRKKKYVSRKNYCNDDGARVYRTMSNLWDSDSQRQGALNILKPIGYQSEYRAFWQESVQGKILSEMCPKSDVFVTGVAQAASQTAVFHQTKLADCSDDEPDRMRSELTKLMMWLTNINAQCLTQTEILVERLLIDIPAVHIGPWALLHGNLGPDTLLVHENNVYLIELDGIHYGDPHVDLGNFVATILDLGLSDKLPQDRVNQAIKIFLRTYDKAVPWTISDNTLRWHVSAALLVNRAVRCMTGLKLGYMERLIDLVNLADRIMAGPVHFEWLKSRSIPVRTTVVQL